MTVVGVLLMAAGLALMFMIGRHSGRVAERHKPTLSPVEAANRIEAANNVAERSLRAVRGLPRVHQSPDTAPVIRRARIRRG